jgi:RHS repeat-associated protein
VRLFAWDYRNRLTAVRDYTGYVDEQNPGTLVMEAQYTYDAGNRRISKTVDADGAGGGTAETTWFVHDGAHVAMQFNWGQSTGRRFLYGPAVDQVLSNGRENGDLLWSLADHQGSVRDIIDASGNPIDTVTYTAFGEVIGDAPDFLFGYTGAVFDIETGLGYHRARYLDHATGRWLSEDPIGFAADVNLYRYVGNSPTNFTDPEGLKAVRFRVYDIRRRGPEDQDKVIGDLKLTLNVDTSPCKVDCDGACRGRVFLSLFFDWTPQTVTVHGPG